MTRLALLAALALCTSCIAVPSRSDEPAPVNPGSDRSKVALKLDLSSKKGSSWDIADERAIEAVREALLDTGYFSEIVGSTAAHDLALAVDIALVPSKNEDGVSLLAGLTLGLLPVWLTHDVALTAVATSPGTADRRYSYQSDVVEFGWLPLLLASPFFTTSAAAGAVIRDGMADVVRQMVEDGSLTVKPTLRAAAG